MNQKSCEIPPAVAASTADPETQLAKRVDGRSNRLEIATPDLGASTGPESRSRRLRETNVNDLNLR
jgi:hypothetical protein